MTPGGVSSLGFSTVLYIIHIRPGSESGKGLKQCGCDDDDEGDNSKAGTEGCVAIVTGTRCRRATAGLV